jgi:3-oxoacyl-[acyl-carrier protein] reductase
MPCKELTVYEDFYFYNGSVNEITDIEVSVNDAVKKMGRVDVLINNAAYKVFKTPPDMTDGDYVESVNTNLTAPIMICSRFIPVFIKQNQGHIINISSNAGMTSYEEGTAYCSSKAGLISYTMSLAKFLKDKKITVNAVSPPTFTTSDYIKENPEALNKKLLSSGRVIKVIENIIFNKKFITGKNYPLFKLKTLIKFFILKNLEIIGYLFQFRIR